jgi:hypothetical protein
MPLNEADAETAMLSTKVDIVAKLVQAGFAPEAAARLVGIKVAHTGATPVTVQQMSAPDDESESHVLACVDRHVVRQIDTEIVRAHDPRSRCVAHSFPSAFLIASK